MTRATALKMIEEYQTFSGGDGPLHRIRERFPEDGSESKAMRWLGFCQGYLVAKECFSLAEVKEHSMRGEVGIL
jgi:hypothetical protein